jgi:hypothetical protein
LPRSAWKRERGAAVRLHWNSQRAYARARRVNRLNGNRNGKYNYNPLPLRVNGDDCLFRGLKSRSNRFEEGDYTQSITQVWTTIAAFGGLTPSVGKSYVSSLECEPCFAVINSCTYYLDKQKGIWERVKYINMGIVYGQPKVGSRENLSFNDLGTLHRELKETTPEDCWELASAMFIKRNRNVLNKYPDIPWNMPTWLGGPGLIPESETHNDYFDRKCAAFIRIELLKLRPRRLEYAVELDNFVKKELNLDKIHYRGARPLLSAEEVDIFTDVLDEQDLRDNSEQLYASMCIETVLTKPIEDFTTVCFEGLSDRNTYKDHLINIHNNNIWRRAARYAKEVQYNYILPIEKEDVQPVKIDSYFPVVVY